MLILKSPRLHLYPLDYEALRLWKDSRNLMEMHLGLEPSDRDIESQMRMDIHEAIPGWLDLVSANPDNFEWYTNWEIVLKEENRSIGSMGLSGFPGSLGNTYIGYVIDARYRRRGFMVEALERMLEFAFSEPSCRQILAETPKDNLPSQKVLLKCGFDFLREKKNLYIWSKERTE